MCTAHEFLRWCLTVEELRRPCTSSKIKNITFTFIKNCVTFIIQRFKYVLQYWWGDYGKTKVYFWEILINHWLFCCLKNYNLIIYVLFSRFYNYLPNKIFKNMVPETSSYFLMCIFWYRICNNWSSRWAGHRWKEIRVGLINK